jgi:glucans biosynthesis protein
MKRRELLVQSGVALLGAALLALTRRARADEARFDYAWLKGHARALSLQPYQAPVEKNVPALASMRWEDYQAVRFRPERALWANAASRFRVRFFHLGLHYRKPVRIHEVVDGRAQEIHYDAGMFDFANTKHFDAHGLPSDLGFAGFRIHFHTDFDRDIASFLGASYFRAVGAEKQYGLSARGLAINSGMTQPEEFPDFTAFWFERPAPNADRLTLYALLDSPSVAGAYRFDIEPGAALGMRIDAALYPRRAIAHAGIAPLTSMFVRGSNDQRVPDWRPQIHDSDGLAAHTGSGEWLWRALVNPASVRVNSFVDKHPAGFGLLQRDRDYDHYQDDGAFYDRRPSAWVEPLSGFGDGAVQLVELPAVDETADNVVAFWNPAAPLKQGEEALFAYRLAWGAKAPAPPLAVTTATRTGNGGAIGTQHDHFSWRFVVDFSGSELAALPAQTKIEPVIEARNGTIEQPSIRPIERPHGQRVTFDVHPNGKEPVDLRMFLRANGRALTETWLYQWVPPVA